MASKTSRRSFLQAAGLTAAAGIAGGASLQPQAAMAKSDKPSLPLGLASYSLREFSLDETLAMTKRVGLAYICLKDKFHLPLDSTPDQLKAAAEKAKQAGLALYGGGVIYMRDEAGVHQAFDYAKAAGMTCIVGVAGPDLLPLVDKKVKQYDIKVAIHNHGPGDDVYPTPQSVYDRVKPYDQRIGLCIDIGHTVRVGADLFESTKRCADRLHDVHIKDVTSATPEGTNAELGRGVIDIPRFIKLLFEIGYPGIVSFEFEKDKEDPLPGLAESVGYARGVMAAI